MYKAILRWLTRRAASDRNRVSITIASSRADRTEQVDLPGWAARGFIGSVVVAVVVLFLGVVGTVFLIRSQLEQRRLRTENETLREQIEGLAELETKVQELEAVRQQILNIAGVPEEETFPDTGEGGGGEEDRVEAPAGRVDLSELADETWNTPLRRLPFSGPVSRGFVLDEATEPDHAGVDVAGAVGTAIVAPADGRVVYSGWDDTFGNFLILRHRAGWETRYGHNQSLLVQEGDTVTAGTRIALMGNTGRSSAPHLHFEVLRDGHAVDPGGFFRSYRER